MNITYKPEGGTEQSWVFKPAKVRQSEAEVIEARAGCDWDTFITKVQEGASRARRVLLWHLMRREHPTLRYEDTPDFLVGELVVQFDADELRNFITALDDPKATFTPEQREQLRVGLQAELEQAEAAGDSGKAL